MMFTHLGADAAIASQKAKFEKQFPLPKVLPWPPLPTPASVPSCPYPPPSTASHVPPPTAEHIAWVHVSGKQKSKALAELAAGFIATNPPPTDIGLPPLPNPVPNPAVADAIAKFGELGAKSKATPSVLNLDLPAARARCVSRWRGWN